MRAPVRVWIGYDQQTPITAMTPTQKRIADGWLTVLSLVVAALALVAAATGILTAPGAIHHSFLTLRGETVAIQGGGLYANESVSGAAQAIGQDVVTLLVGIPLLLVATYLALRGSVRGQLLRAGALWYFAYTYLLMAFGGAYNPFFLVYVAMFSASLVAFILALHAVDVARLPERFSRRFARRAVGGLLIGFGALLALLWLGRIIPALATGTPPAGLESYSTLFVQAGDLGLVVPLAIVAGALLLRRRPLGYLLASVLLVKGVTFGLAVVAMIVSMALAGTPAAFVEVAFFVTLTAVLMAALIHLLLNVSSRRTGTGAGMSDASMVRSARE